MKLKTYLSFMLAIVLVLVCALWPQSALSHDTLTTTVLFDREIVRILNGHCVMCHDVNGPATPLDTYEQTFLLRRDIRYDVIGHRMAPWAAVSGYGSFANDNSLTLREIQFFVSWAEGWGPRNAGTAYTDVSQGSGQPKVIQAHVDFDRWTLGKPAKLLELSPNTIAPQQKERIERTVVDLGLTSDRWLSGLEYKPSDHRVVRAAFFTVQETGQWLGSWTPWYGRVGLQRGLAYRLPAGSHIVAEIYYHPWKEALSERGSLGLFFTNKPSEKTIYDIVLDSKTPAPGSGDSQEFRAEAKLANDTSILAFRPEIQPGMQSLEVSARKADGGTQVLLFAKDFSLEWPTPYILKEPVTLSRGTVLLATAHYSGAAASPQPTGIHLIVSAYHGSELAQPEPEPDKMPKPIPQRYKLDGTVQTLNIRDGKLTVQHSAIPGLMPPMTMQYDAGKQEDLKKLAIGDQIQADLIVVGSEMHLENIKIVSRVK